MNVSDFLQILQKSETILSPKQTRALEDMLVEYPYFQAARALYLKGLKNLDSYKYNSELKITAAYTTDREVLFDFITSREFDQNKIANAIIGRTSNLPEIKTIAEEVAPNPETKTFLGESEEKPLPQNIDHAENILHPELFENKVEKDVQTPEVAQENEEQTKETLGIGKPISFTKNEKHSFSEWLQLASQKNIRKEEPKEAKTKNLTKGKNLSFWTSSSKTTRKLYPKETRPEKLILRSRQQSTRTS